MTYLAEVNFLDLLLIVFLFCCIIAGIVRGFTSDMLGMFTWVGGVICTYALLPYSAPFIKQWITHDTFAKGIAISSSFLLSLVLLALINKGISHIVKNSVLGGLDKALGLFSGTLRTIVISTGIYLLSLIFLTQDNMPRVLIQSKLMSIFDYTAIFTHKQLCTHKGFCPNISAITARTILASSIPAPRLKHRKTNEKTVTDMIDSL